jgi:hypothetical protein
MTFNEAGNRQLSVQFDDARGVADQQLELGARSDGEDPIPAYGNGLGQRLPVIHGDDAPAPEHQVRVLLPFY